jgi:GntR family transcriptional regulator
MRSAIPKYLTVKALLQTRMLREMKGGELLPSEAVLCVEFGVSRITIQQAMKLLGQEGWLRRERGRGTFFLGQPLSQTEQQPSELLETLLSRTNRVKIKVVRKGTQVPPHRVAETLQLAPGAHVVYLERLGIVDGKPLLFIYTYLPYELGVNLLENRDALGHLTIAAQLEDRYGIEIGEVQQTISASLADPHFAASLGVDMGSPVLEGQRTYFDRAGKPIFCTTSFYRADRHRFVVRLKDWRN